MQSSTRGQAIFIFTTRGSKTQNKHLLCMPLMRRFQEILVSGGRQPESQQDRFGQIWQLIHLQCDHKVFLNVRITSTYILVSVLYQKSYQDRRWICNDGQVSNVSRPERARQGRISLYKGHLRRLKTDRGGYSELVALVIDALGLVCSIFSDCVVLCCVAYSSKTNVA